MVWYIVLQKDIIMSFCENVLILLMINLIDQYFYEGFTYKEIMALLQNEHSLKINLSKWYFKWGNGIFIGRENNFIQHELDSSIL